MEKIKILIFKQNFSYGLSPQPETRISWIEFPCGSLSKRGIKRAFKNLGDKFLAKEWKDAQKGYDPRTEILITDGIKIGNDIFIKAEKSGITEWKIGQKG